MSHFQEGLKRNLTKFKLSYSYVKPKDIKHLKHLTIKCSNKRNICSKLNCELCHFSLNKGAVKIENYTQCTRSKACCVSLFLSVCAYYARHYIRHCV